MTIDHHIHLFYSCRYWSISETAGQGIKNLQQFNAAIDKGQNRCVGFLSDTDFWSVHLNISGHRKPIYFATTDDLYAAMEGKKILPGLVRGIVNDNTSSCNVFPAGCISPQAFQIKKGQRYNGPVDDSRYGRSSYIYRNNKSWSQESAVQNKTCTKLFRGWH